MIQDYLQWRYFSGANLSISLKCL